MQRVLLDTCIFIPAAIDGLSVLPVKARRILQNPDTELLLSSISITEIAIKNGSGKLNFTAGFLRQATADMRLASIAFNTNHAERLFDLPLHHRDPFDRMLIAIALSENLPILTSDDWFGHYEGLRVVKV